jgi:hypothetical protein
LLVVAVVRVLVLLLRPTAPLVLVEVPVVLF